MILFPCPRCSSQIKAEDKQAGQRGHCTACQARLIVPPHGGGDEEKRVAVSIQCPSCLETIGLSSERIGASVPCPWCGAIIDRAGLAMPEAARPRPDRAYHSRLYYACLIGVLILFVVVFEPTRMEKTASAFFCGLLAILGALGAIVRTLQDIHNTLKERR